MKKFVSENLNEWLNEDLGNKRGFYSNIEADTLENESFRKVLYTGKNIQLVLMTLPQGENIGMETHDVDQFFRFEEGTGQVIINDMEYNVKDGDSVIIPADAVHDVINTGNSPLKMYTLYAPPHHQDGIEFKSKEEAENSKEEFSGNTSE